MSGVDVDSAYTLIEVKPPIQYVDADTFRFFSIENLTFFLAWVYVQSEISQLLDGHED